MNRYRVEASLYSFPALFINDVSFHSLRNPFAEALLLEKWRDSRPLPRFLFLVEIGLGYVMKFFRTHPEIKNQIFLICLFQQEDMREIFESARDSLNWPKEVISLNFSHKAEWESLLFSFPPKEVGIWVHPNFQRLFPEESQNIQEIFYLSLKRSFMNQITDVAFGFRWWRNALRNLIFGKITPLPKRYKGEERPFLLIGSGLSTYEQIQNIRQCQSQYWVMAALPALDLLRKYEVIPDIVVITDPASANRHYQNVRLLPHKTLLLAYGYAYSLILEWFPGQVFVMNGGLEQEQLLSPMWERIPSGGSVANTMLELAKLWTKKVFYTGFDFQYSKNHPHYPGAPLETQRLHQASRFSQAETYFARQVYNENNILIPHSTIWTSPVLKAYDEYFQEQCQDFQSIGGSLAPLCQKELEKARKISTKGDFVQGYFQNQNLKPLSQKQKLSQLEKIRDFIKESLKQGDFQNPFWKSLLAKSLLKKEEGYEIFEKELQFVKNLICLLSQSLTTNETPKIKDE